MATAAFDALAREYDATFSDTLLGRVLRRALWGWLDRAFASGDRILELNCGTGEDALHLAGRGVRLLATDASPEMLEVARAKLRRAGLPESVELRQLAIERLDRLGEEFRGALDGAFSSFGGLNCVADLAAAAHALALVLRPGARVVLCVMGALVPWEWVWFLGHGQPGKAVRRLAPGGARWRGMTVRYPSVRATRAAFAQHFRTRRVGGLGALLPPTYAEAWARRHPLLVERLDRWERRIEEWPVVPHLADHYLVELERR
jgi:SAM-dependent methyltransferase